MRILAFVICIALWSTSLSAEEVGFSELQRFKDEGVYVYREQYTGPTPKSQRPKSFRGFTKMRSQFVALCRALKEDGRVEMIQQRIYPHQQKRDDCIACKPLMKTINKACTLGLKTKKKKSRRGKKSKEDEDAQDQEVEHEIYKERLPSLSVHSLVAEIFNDIVNEPALAEESLKATNLLVEVLTPVQENTPAEREYLTSLTNFIESPFRQMKREKEQKKERKEEESSTLDTGWTIQDQKSYSFDTSVEF